MAPLAIFGIENEGVSLAVSLLVLFLAVLWLALVYWTYADARRRLEDPMLIGCATAAALFPFIGTVVYMIVRPPEYLEDRHERELEIAAAEARLAQVERLICPYCEFEVEKTFLRCPSCLRRLKEPCATCGRPLDPRWKICPYCEAEVGQAPPPRRRQPRAAARAPAPPERAASRPRARPAEAPEPTRAADRPSAPRPAQRPAASRPAQRPASAPPPRQPAPQRGQAPPPRTSDGAPAPPPETARPRPAPPPADPGARPPLREGARTRPPSR